MATSDYDQLLDAPEAQGAVKVSSPYDSLLTASDANPPSQYDALLSNEAPSKYDRLVSHQAMLERTSAPIIPTSTLSGDLQNTITQAASPFIQGGEEVVKTIAPLAHLVGATDVEKTLRQSVKEYEGTPAQQTIEGLVKGEPAKTAVAGNAEQLSPVGRKIGSAAETLLISELAPAANITKLGKVGNWIANNLIGSSPALVQSAIQSYDKTFQETGDANAALASTKKPVAEMAIYFMASALGAKALQPFLKTAPPIVKGIVGAGSASATNAIVSAGLRAQDAQPGHRIEDATKWIESLPQDAIFGLAHGAREGINASIESKATLNKSVEDIQKTYNLSQDEAQAAKKLYDRGLLKEPEASVPAEPSQTPATDAEIKPTVEENAITTTPKQKTPVAIAEPPQEIPLGQFRETKIDPSLSGMKDDDFFNHWKASRDVVDKLERAYDDAGSEFSNAQKTELAKAQDEFRSADLEKFKRDSSEISSEDLFSKLTDISKDFSKSNPDRGSKQYARAKILIDLLKQRPDAASGFDEWAATHNRQNQKYGQSGVRDEALKINSQKLKELLEDVQNNSASVETPAVETKPASLGGDVVETKAAGEPVEAQGNGVNTAGRLLEDIFGKRDTGIGITASDFYKNKAVKEYADSWVDRVKSFLNVKDAFKRYLGASGQRDMIAATFDAADNKAGYVARQAGNHVKLGGDETNPHIEDIKQKAATFVRQAGGDKAGMLAKLEAIKGKGYDSTIEYAKNHWDELQKIADRAKEGTDAAAQEMDSAGINFDYRSNYVKGAYEDPFTGKIVLDEKGGGRGTSTSFTKQKVFNDYAEAIAAGFKPKELRLDKLTESAVLASLKAVNRARWVESLGQLKMPDGNPVVTEMITNKRTLNNEDLKVDDAGNVISPSGVSKTSSQAPDGYKPVLIGNERYAVHEDVAPTVDALTAMSRIPSIIPKFSAFIKHNILVWDIFHASRFGQMQAGFEGKLPGYNKGLSALEFSDKSLGEAVEQGIIKPEEAAWAKENRPVLESMISKGLNIGRISDSLYKDVVPIMPGARFANNFIFDKLSRGIIAHASIYARERNAALHPEWTAEKLDRFTAKEVNEYFRNLGNQGIFKSKTFQDLARTFLLAPQWFEGMIRSEARGYGQAAKGLVPGKEFGKFGNISKGMGTGLAAYFAVSQVINMITRGKPTWENDEPGKKLDAWIPDSIQGSRGFFISPMSVFAETTHDITKYIERGIDPTDAVSQVGSNKLSPAVRGLWAISSGHDFYGRPLHGLDRYLEGAKQISPIPLAFRTGGVAGGAERQLLSTAGIKVTPAPSAVSSVHELAKTFLREHGIETPEFAAGEYTKMRTALREGDLETAREEYDTLLKKKKVDQISKAMIRYKQAPFTGVNVQESKFRKTLDRGQTDLYAQAIKERDQIVKNFWLMKRQGKP